MKHRKCRLLIVEDDIDYAELIGAKLTGFRSEFEITVARTYDEAAWLMSWREFDFGLIDTFLGGPRTGIALIRELRLQGNKLPVAILSAATRGPLRKVALDLGAIAIIDKAYAKMEDIVEIIDMNTGAGVDGNDVAAQPVAGAPDQNSSCRVSVAPELGSIAATR